MEYVVFLIYGALICVFRENVVELENINSGYNPF